MVAGLKNGSYYKEIFNDESSGCSRRTEEGQNVSAGMYKTEYSRCLLEGLPRLICSHGVGPKI